MTASPEGSLIPAVKAAVVELLRDASYPAQVSPYPSGRPGPQVSYSEPRDLEYDRIIVGDTSGAPGEQEWFTFQPSRRETFELALVVVSACPGQSAEEATDRAFGMFTTVARAILAAAQPDDGADRLGIPGVLGVQIRQPSHTDSRGDEGWECVIESGIRVEGWVAP